MEQKLQFEILSRFFHLQQDLIQGGEQFIEHFNQKYQSECTPLQIQSVLYVEDINNFDENLLLNNQHLGVDIEQSNLVGFDGKICLIQFKTQNQDIILDAIRITDQRRLVDILKRVFEDPLIKKIFYAGSQDQIWLQRDYKIFINNYCDIKELAEQLQKKTDNSLVALWKQHCNFLLSKEEKKQFQTSNWLDRPLSQKQLEYAALDSHYLPHLWQLMVTEAHKNINYADIIKLQLKFEKPKIYEREGSTRYYYLKQIQSSLDDTLDDFADYHDDESYNEKNATQKNIIKFIYSELCFTFQNYALHKDVPVSSLDDEDTILIQAVVLSQKLTINGLDKMQTFYDDMKSYTNKDYEYRKEQLPLVQTYMEYKNLIANGFMNALQLDSQFVRWALTEVYYTETYKQLQQQKDKKKVEEKHQRTLKYNTTTKEVYGECKILAPDNMLLCNCTEKKGKWYVKNDRAELVSESPMVIRLNFQPSGFEVTKMEGDEEISERQYYTTERVNQCVVCGAKSNLLKYNILPPSYKSHFPQNFKVAKTHGFVLLCLQCHDKANVNQEDLKEIIALEYQVPTKIFSDDSKLIQKVQSLQKQTKQFQNKSLNYPKDVRRKFKLQIRQSLDEIINNIPQSVDLNQQLSESKRNKNNNLKINQALYDCISDLDVLIDQNIEQKILNLDKCEVKNIHGQLVVEKLKEDKDFELFIERWRQNFLSIMKPQFLPDAWYIDGKPKSSQQVYYQQ